MNRTRLLVVLVVMTIVLIPGRFSLRSLDVYSNRAADVRGETAELHAKAEAAEAVRANPGPFQRDQKHFTDAIPAEPRLEEVISDIGDAISSSGLEWKAGSPSPSPAATEAGMSSWAMTLNVAGDANGVITFLDKIRKLDRLFIVDGVQLTAGTGNRVEATVTARFFSTLAPESAPTS